MFKKIFFLLIFSISSCKNNTETKNNPNDSANQQKIKIGWIGALTGPVTKFGSYQAAQIALEDINASGGINGKPLELIFEDGQCNGKFAVSAAKKLIELDKVNLILGGHCTPESLAIAPIVETKKVVMLAASTTTPKLSNAGDYVFRLSPVNTSGTKLIIDYLKNTFKPKKIAIFYELTDYAAPPAELLKSEIEKNPSMELVFFESFNTGETDFRTLISRLKSKEADAIYVGTQSQDSASLVVKQIKEQNISTQLFGNEVFGGVVVSHPEQKADFENSIYAEPFFDPTTALTSPFVDKYEKKFGTRALPFGIWTAEAYDTVMLLAKLVKECGESAEAIKTCLYQVKDYAGASGIVSIDSNGDGVRKYYINKIVDGKPQRIGG